MPPYFSERRSAELSTFNFLKTQIEANWTSINVLKSFTQAYDKGINPPIITIHQEDTAATRREIGSTSLLETYTIITNIFARSHGQRIDLAAFILGQLKDGWAYNVYSHSSGDPEILDAVASGRMSVIDYISDGPINLGENVDVKDRFRHIITVTVRVHTT